MSRRKRYLVLATLGAGLAALGVFALPAGATEQKQLSEISIRSGETKTYALGNSGITATASLRADAENSVGTQSCWIGKIDYRATSVGLHQHTWRHEVHYCFNGNRAAGAHVNRGINLSNASPWKWKGTNYARKYNMSTHMDVRNQGFYEFCAPGIPYCQEHHPTHHGKYYKGRFTTTLGRAK
jgi:hypothetical protein